MRYYKGYMIDPNNIYGGFANKAEIDAHIRRMAINHYTKLLKLMYNYTDPDMVMIANSQAVDYMNYMHDQIGFTYDEIEEIEISVA